MQADFQKRKKIFIFLPKNGVEKIIKLVDFTDKVC